MKLRNLGQYALWTAAFLVAGPVKSTSAQNWAINVVSLETIVKVQQQHVPGVGANYLVLNIDGKSGGKPMSVSISVNSPGWGAQKMIDSCEKNAMLAMHYPSRYVFEIMSEDTGQDGSVRLNVSDSGVGRRDLFLEVEIPNFGARHSGDTGAKIGELAPRSGEGGAMGAV